MLRKQQGLSCTGMYITQQEEEEQARKKYPKKLTRTKIMMIFLKWSKVDYFPFLSVFA
jgi:hypothetical protein